MGIFQKGVDERELKLQQKEAAKQQRQMLALQKQMAKPMAMPEIVMPAAPKLPATPPETQILNDGSADPTEEARKKAAMRFGLPRTRVAGMSQAAAMGGGIPLGGGDTVLG